MLVGFSSAAYLIGLGYDVDGRICTWLALASAVSLIAVIRCYLQYRTFTFSFATTVWRDFTVYALSAHKDEPLKIPFE